jgi:hypothetical protein
VYIVVTCRFKAVCSLQSAASAREQAAVVLGGGRGGGGGQSEGKNHQHAIVLALMMLEIFGREKAAFGLYRRSTLSHECLDHQFITRCSAISIATAGPGRC